VIIYATYIGRGYCSEVAFKTFRNLTVADMGRVAVRSLLVAHYNLVSKIQTLCWPPCCHSAEEA
jgi:hypothetical protein